MIRTTLAIDDDVLTAAKALAQERRTSVGEVVSDLARRALQRPASPEARNGVPLLLVRDSGAVVTLEIVNGLRDELA